MHKEQVSKLSVEELSGKLDGVMIKNFIISDTDHKNPEIPLNHPCVVDGIVFTICIQGKGSIKINLKQYEVEKNTIITLPPGSIVEFLDKSDDLMIEYLFFSFDFISALRINPKLEIHDKVFENPCLKLSDEETYNLLDLHAFIVKQYEKRDHIFREEIAKSLLWTLMAEVAAIYHDSKEKLTKASTHNEELLNSFLRLMIKHYKEERSVIFYADKMCLTPKYLSSKIKDISGKSITEWINQAIILSTKALLKSSSLTVLQISEELNFPNPSFFGRFFKKHTGMTPVEYRES